MRAAAADKKRREAENRAVLAERDLAAAEKEVAELRARLAAGGGDGGSDAVGTLASDLKVAQLEEELRNVSAQLDRAIERQDAVSERERRVSAREQAVAEAELDLALAGPRVPLPLWPIIRAPPRPSKFTRAKTEVAYH